MAVPQIDLLPSPALPTDPEDVFDAKVGASLTAEQAMVPQINTSLTWIGDQMTAVDGYRQAAATSATNAASSATAANTSKNAAATSATQATTNGATQVTLAAAQVTLAQQARDSAQVAAAAAQAAAGLPSLVGNAYKVLRVNAGATGVEWGLGLPVLPSVGGAPGKVLNIAANGTSLAWAEIDKVGDIITGTRNPGSLWLPADGSIRLQSAYPALFATLGLIGNNIGSVWQATSAPFTAVQIASGANGTTIIVNGTQVSRSTDKGQTWSSAAALVLSNLNDIGTDGKGTWILTSSAASPSAAKRSTDDGLTWADINLPSVANSGWNRPTYVGGTTWVAKRNATADTTLAISTTNGATWSTVTHGAGSVTIQDIASDEAGTVIFITATAMRRSQDFASTFSAISLTGSPTLSKIGTDKLGTWIASGNGASSSYLSLNNGLGFNLTPIGPSLTPVSIINADAGLLVLFASTTQYFYRGGTIGSFTSPGALTAQTSSPGNNILLTQAGAQRALPFIYDTTTQFQLPAMPVVSGVKSYIKALEAAA